MGKKVEIDRLTRIYSLSDPDTGEIRYIGKTVKKLNKRLQGHIWAIKREKNHRTNWINSIINKNKIPVIKLICECSWENSQFWEIHFIEKFKRQGFNLVNESIGGEGNLGLKYNKERLHKHIEGLRNASKGVYQYDLKGNFIKKWRSLMDAAEALQLKNANICQCCNLGKKSHGGFIWSYDNPNIFNIEKYKHKIPVFPKKTYLNNGFIRKQKAVKITNLKTNEIIITISIKEASDLTGKTKSGICCECKGLRKVRGKYKFEYYES